MGGCFTVHITHNGHFFGQGRFICLQRGTPTTLLHHLGEGFKVSCPLFLHLLFLQTTRTTLYRCKNGIIGTRLRTFLGGVFRFVTLKRTLMG